MLLGLFLYIPFRGQPVAEWNEGWKQGRESVGEGGRESKLTVFLLTQNGFGWADRELRGIRFRKRSVRDIRKVCYPSFPQLFYPLMTRQFFAIFMKSLKTSVCHESLGRTFQA